MIKQGETYINGKFVREVFLVENGQYFFRERLITDFNWNGMSWFFDDPDDAERGFGKPYRPEKITRTYYLNIWTDNCMAFVFEENALHQASEKAVSYDAVAVPFKVEFFQGQNLDKL